MLELLRDPVWQFIGAVIAVLGIGAGFWVYWLQRQKKELAFGMISSRRMLSIADEVSSRVTVQLDGNSITDLHLLVYGLKNSGHRAIAPSDFERPLSITCSDGQVVSAEVTSQLPSNLGATLAISESRVELQPLLLNSGDQLLIQILLSAPIPATTVDARIVDIPVLTLINTRRRPPRFLDSMMPLMIAIFLLYGGITYFIGGHNIEHLMVFVGAAVYAALYSLGSHLLERIRPSSRRYVDEA